MARVGISYDQVAAAADALVGAGQKPSIRNVREALGNTGSPNTVHRHLTEWRAAQPVAQGAAYELPADLVNSFGRELARGAAAARAEVEADLVQAQAEAAELAATGEALEVERDELTAQVAALTTERDQAQATADERAQEIARLAEQVQREQQAAEGARVELATARLKIEQQAEQVGELRTALEVAQKALAEAQAGRQQMIQYGAITTPAGQPLAARLVQIAQDMETLITQFQPDEMSIEGLFFSKNITTGIAVAHARGVILYTAERLHLPVYEYTPMQIKQAVVGYGLADKHQVMDMTRRLLKLRSIPRPDDAADALAIAMCHARSATSLLRRKDPDVKETV